ncbi:MAG: putative D-ribose transporter permease protein, partial [Modestobacter sp.]|nr:putative D-ribose transporter permease protein [Modestobacter sp.]
MSGPSAEGRSGTAAGSGAEGRTAALPLVLWRGVRRQGHLVVGIAAVVLVGFALSPYFLTGNNLRNIVITGAVVSVLAVGQFMVIVTAGIDLSVGAVTALSTVLAA